MTQTDKPYRRFRAHGPEEIEPSEALDAIRALRQREAGADEQPAREPRPAPRRDRGRPPRRTDGPRRWWSLRNRTPGEIGRRVAAVIGLAVLIWAVAGFVTFNNAAKAANKHISNTARRALADPGGGLLGTPENTLVIGSDSRRGGTGGRADTILIMRTDPDTGKLNYLSLPRDLRVAWGDGNHIKLGETFSHRGITGLIGSIRNELGIPIHHILLVDFGSVSKMVDAVGGIEVKNPFNLKNCPYPGGTSVTFPKGKLELDGATALQYARVRKCDGDIQRAERQQLVVGALKSKVLSFWSLPLAPWRGARIVRTLSTDMGTFDLAKFGWLQARLKPGTKQVLATDSAYIGGISYQILNPDAAAPQVRAFSGG